LSDVSAGADRLPHRGNRETLYLLGEQDRIVGISGYCVRPPKACRDKPRVSDFTSGDIPKILDLRPDLVLRFSDLQADIVATLIRQGVAVHAFNQRTIAEIFDMMRMRSGRWSASPIALTALPQSWKLGSPPLGVTPRSCRVGRLCISRNGTSHDLRHYLGLRADRGRGRHRHRRRSSRREVREGADCDGRGARCPRARDHHQLTLPGTEGFHTVPRSLPTAFLEEWGGKREEARRKRESPSYEFALASAAVALDLVDGAVNAARTALGGVASRPWLAREEENLLNGNKLDEALARRAADTAFAYAEPRAANCYKVDLGKRTPRASRAMPSARPRRWCRLLSLLLLSRRDRRSKLIRHHGHDRGKPIFRRAPPEEGSLRSG
jgi:hypothetical protein